MANIQVLDQLTINKIAAGEVIERPASVVKELLENAIDAGASAITVEIKDGGISFIRITDNGCGIETEQVPIAFLRHATSKIQSVEDLFTVSSLGFRGEALSSICAVSQLELITKTSGSLTGSRYLIDGGEEKVFEEIGAPEGTTFLVRNLFYNTPVRRKFLKTPATEGAHVAEVVEKIALSHPEVSIRFIQNNQSRLHTAGNYNLKDMVYTVFGREISANLLEVSTQSKGVCIKGFIAKPVIARSNRNYENYFINGRYIKSSMIQKAIEEAYRPFMMQHKYPFTLLHLTIEPGLLDINVHPTKMELRFLDGEFVYQLVYSILEQALSKRELIPQVQLSKEPQKPQEEKKVEETHKIEPFEKNRKETIEKPIVYEEIKQLDSLSMIQEAPAKWEEKRQEKQKEEKQLDLFTEKLLEPKSRIRHKLIGQLFDTYWMVEFGDQLYMIDQHAAHEKVLYETTMMSLRKRDYTSQAVNPPIILTLSQKEEVLLVKYLEYFSGIGFEIEPFGGKEYAVRGVPANLFSVAKKELLMEMIDGLSEEYGRSNPEMIYEKVASISCKAAVKGNQSLSSIEANELIDQLLDLENPYSCPHGRPTIISMTKYELEKKFKRVL